MANGLIDFEFTTPHGYFQKLYAHVTEKSLAFAGAFLRNPFCVIQAIKIMKSII